MKFAEYTLSFTHALRFFSRELNEFGEINMTERRRAAGGRIEKVHEEAPAEDISGVGLLIPALEALEASRGGEACLRRSAPINSARRSPWTYGGARRKTIRGPISHGGRKREREREREQFLTLNIITRIRPKVRNRFVTSHQSRVRPSWCAHVCVCVIPSTFPIIFFRIYYTRHSTHLT